MDDELEDAVVAVRVDRAAFAREVAAMRAELEGPFGDSAMRAGRVLERSLISALRTGQLGFDDLRRTALAVMAEIAAASIRLGFDTLFSGGKKGGIGWRRRRPVTTSARRGRRSGSRERRRRSAGRTADESCRRTKLDCRQRPDWRLPREIRFAGGMDRWRQAIHRAGGGHDGMAQGCRALAALVRIGLDQRLAGGFAADRRGAGGGPAPARCPKPFWWNDNRRGGADGDRPADCDLKVAWADRLTTREVAPEPCPRQGVWRSSVSEPACSLPTAAFGQQNGGSARLRALLASRKEWAVVPGWDAKRKGKIYAEARHCCGAVVHRARDSGIGAQQRVVCRRRFRCDDRRGHPV